VCERAVLRATCAFVVNTGLLGRDGIAKSRGSVSFDSVGNAFRAANGSISLGISGATNLAIKGCSLHYAPSLGSIA